MRHVAAIFVLLSTVVTALVGVRMHGENRRLEYQVWHEMRKRDSLAKQISEVRGRIDLVFAPRALLEVRERRHDETAGEVEGGTVPGGEPPR